MAVWDKNTAVVWLYDQDTGELDISTHTVEYQPIDQEYNAGVIHATQMSSKYAYKPNSDLDADTHYWIYVDSIKKFKFIALNSSPNMGVG